MELLTILWGLAVLLNVLMYAVMQFLLYIRNRKAEDLNWQSLIEPRMNPLYGLAIGLFLTAVNALYLILLLAISALMAQWLSAAGAIMLVFALCIYTRYAFRYRQ